LTLFQDQTSTEKSQTRNHKMSTKAKVIWPDKE
jgi:hypothetical protein